MDTKFTKGEWRFSEEYRLITTCLNGFLEDSKTVCILENDVSNDQTGEEAYANGLLISCAPEFLKICLENYMFHQRKSNKDIEYSNESVECRNQLKNIIAKAINVPPIVIQEWVLNLCKLSKKEIGKIDFI